MRVPDYFQGDDDAHRILLPYLAETERTLNLCVRTIDADGIAEIEVAADLGFPHDVLRLCGGFATGVLVQWRCDQPFVPVDIAMNADVSSIFWLDDDWASALTGEDFRALEETFAASSYEFNFHKGNHFISAGRSANGQPALVVHSNEKEFKFQSNGLIPVDGNWFFERIQQFEVGGRRVRYLVGEPAARFICLARSLDLFSIERHRFVASVLGRFAGWHSENHHVHYGMPSDGCALLGAFLCEPGDVVPIFSAPGRPIDLFQVDGGGQNEVVDLDDGQTRLLVPHGWGRTVAPGAEIEIRNDEVVIDGRRYEAAPQVSLGRDAALVRRSFASDPASPDSFTIRMSALCPGVVVDQIEQCLSFSREGFCRHSSERDALASA